MVHLQMHSTSSTLTSSCQSQLDLEGNRNIGASPLTILNPMTFSEFDDLLEMEHSPTAYLDGREEGRLAHLTYKGILSTLDAVEGLTSAATSVAEHTSKFEKALHVKHLSIAKRRAISKSLASVRISLQVNERTLKRLEFSLRRASPKSKSRRIISRPGVYTGEHFESMETSYDLASPCDSISKSWCLQDQPELGRPGSPSSSSQTFGDLLTPPSPGSMDTLDSIPCSSTSSTEQEYPPSFCSKFLTSIPSKSRSRTDSQSGNQSLSSSPPISPHLSDWTQSPQCSDEEYVPSSQ